MLPHHVISRVKVVRIEGKFYIELSKEVLRHVQWYEDDEVALGVFMGHTLNGVLAEDIPKERHHYINSRTGGTDRFEVGP